MIPVQYMFSRYIIDDPRSIMEQRTFKNVNNCLNTNIYSYLETSAGQISDPYLNVVHFFNTRVNRYLWQLKTAVFLHWCLICALPLMTFASVIDDHP